MAENNEPVNPEPTPLRLPASVPRRNVSAERQTPVNTDRADEAMAALADSMKVLAKHFGNEEEDAAEKERPGRRVKKFQRSGVSEDRAAAPASRSGGKDEAAAGYEPAPAAAGEKAAAAAFNKNVAWPRTGQSDPPEGEEPRVVRPGKKKRNKWAVLALVQGTGFALLLGGFWLGQITASSDEKKEGSAAQSAARPPRPGDQFRIGERELQAASSALHAAHQGNAEDAEKQLNQLLVTSPEVPGVHYQLARLALFTGDALAADLHLDRSSDAGEYMAACAYTRARLAGTKGNYAEAARQFQGAAHEEPFNGHIFFYWAEALRRQGQPLSAISAFDQAIDRAHTKAEGTLYLFKEKLARVEASNDEAFNAELDDHLKQPHAEGEWWLLGAARDILRSNPPAAAEALKKAAATLGAGEYDILIKDYLFQTMAGEPTLGPLIQRPAVPESTEHDGFYPDPTVMPPSFGDPAIWPVAPKE